MIENWKDVIGYEGIYIVSDQGRIKSLKKGGDRLLKNRISLGYNTCILYKNGKSKTLKVHRLVSQSFIPNPENKPFVNHKNGVRNDNRVENLEWCTPSENVKHAFDTGLNRISDNHRKILSERQKIRIGKLSPIRKPVINTDSGITYDTVMEACKHLGIKYSTLHARLSGQNKNKTSLKFK